MKMSSPTRDLYISMLSSIVSCCEQANTASSRNVAVNSTSTLHVLTTQQISYLSAFANGSGYTKNVHARTTPLHTFTRAKGDLLNILPSRRLFFSCASMRRRRELLQSRTVFGKSPTGYTLLRAHKPVPNKGNFGFSGLRYLVYSVRTEKKEKIMPREVLAGSSRLSSGSEAAELGREHSDAVCVLRVKQANFLRPVYTMKSLLTGKEAKFISFETRFLN